MGGRRFSRRALICTYTYLHCVTLRFEGNEPVTAASLRVLTAASALTLTPPNATHVPNLGVVRLCGGGDFEELSRSADVAQVFLHQSPRHHHRQRQRIPGKREPDWSSDRQQRRQGLVEIGGHQKIKMAGKVEQQLQFKAHQNRVPESPPEGTRAERAIVQQTGSLDLSSSPPPTTDRHFLQTAGRSFPNQ